MTVNLTGKWVLLYTFHPFWNMNNMNRKTSNIASTNLKTHIFRFKFMARCLSFLCIFHKLHEHYNVNVTANTMCLFTFRFIPVWIPKVDENLISSSCVIYKYQIERWRGSKNAPVQDNVLIYRQIILKNYIHRYNE